MIFILQLVCRTWISKFIKFMMKSVIKWEVQSLIHCNYSFMLLELFTILYCTCTFSTYWHLNQRCVITKYCEAHIQFDTHAVATLLYGICQCSDSNECVEGVSFHRGVWNCDGTPALGDLRHHCRPTTEFLTCTVPIFTLSLWLYRVVSRIMTSLM